MRIDPTDVDTVRRKVVAGEAVRFRDTAEQTALLDPTQLARVRTEVLGLNEGREEIPNAAPPRRKSKARANDPSEEQQEAATDGGETQSEGSRKKWRRQDAALMGGLKGLDWMERQGKQVAFQQVGKQERDGVEAVWVAGRYEHPAGGLPGAAAPEKKQSSKQPDQAGQLQETIMRAARINRTYGSVEGRQVLAKVEQVAGFNK